MVLQKYDRNLFWKQHSLILSGIAARSSNPSIALHHAGSNIPYCPLACTSTDPDVILLKYFQKGCNRILFRVEQIYGWPEGMICLHHSRQIQKIKLLQSSLAA